MAQCAAAAGGDVQKKEVQKWLQTQENTRKQAVEKLSKALDASNKYQKEIQDLQKHLPALPKEAPKKEEEKEKKKTEQEEVKALIPTTTTASNQAQAPSFLSSGYDPALIQYIAQNFHLTNSSFSSLLQLPTFPTLPLLPTLPNLPQLPALPALPLPDLTPAAGNYIMSAILQSFHTLPPLARAAVIAAMSSTNWTPSSVLEALGNSPGVVIDPMPFPVYHLTPAA